MEAVIRVDFVANLIQPISMVKAFAILLFLNFSFAANATINLPAVGSKNTYTCKMGGDQYSPPFSHVDYVFKDKGKYLYTVGATNQAYIVHKVHKSLYPTLISDVLASSTLEQGLKSIPNYINGGSRW